MSNIKEIIERASLDSMIAYLLDESEPVKGKIEISDNAIEESYRDFIAELVQLYPDMDEDNDELMDSIIKFAAIHEEIYFKAGVIAGAKMVRELGDS